MRSRQSWYACAQSQRPCAARQGAQRRWGPVEEEEEEEEEVVVVVVVVVALRGAAALQGVGGPKAEAGC